jgi:hypothetical protein
MHITKRALAGLRALGVVTAVMVVAGGVTFAALQSQDVTLAGNRITSATANLLVGNGDGQFVSSAPGFTFDNVEPGGVAMPVAGNPLYLRNGGTSNLQVRLALNGNALHNPNNLTLSRVFLDIVPAEGGTSQEVSLAALADAYTAGNPVTLNMTAPAGKDTQYLLRVRMADSAVSSTATSVTIYGIDLIFSGVTQSA